MALDVQRIPIEIQFAQGLAGNEQKNRDKTLALLKKFIRLRLPRLKEQLKEDEFIKLWKGMHYQLWMQDKPLIQEKLVEDLCQLIHDFPNETYTLMFIKAFFETEAREWFGLDQWRMNKFMMLVREFLHNSFVFLRNYEWKKSVCLSFSEILEQSVMNCRNINLPIGLKLHLMDIFHIELRRVADDKLSSDTAVILLSPFLNILPTVKNDNVMKKLLTFLFEAGGGQQCPKEIRSKDSDEEPDGFVERKPPRVRRDKLQFNKELLLKQLMEIGAKKKCPSKIRSQIYKLIKRIRSLDTHPQKPIKIVKKKDIDMRVEVSQKAILAAVKRLKKNKEALLEKVPLRKEYKLNLLMEKKKKKKKSEKASTENEINDADTEEEDDDGIDMEGIDEEDDSLDYDAEAEFFQMSTESDDNCGAEIGANVDSLSDDKSLPNGHVEDETAESEAQESPAATEEEEEESPAATKKNKKSKAAGSKRKNEESVENVTQAPEKKVKKAKKEKGEKKKPDDIDDAAAAVDDAEKMEVALPEEKTKKRKRKTKKKSEESVVSETAPVFGMVDFPEEEENSATEEGINETEVVVCEMPKSSEEDKSESEVVVCEMPKSSEESISETEVVCEIPKSSEENNESEEKTTSKKIKKAKKVKQTKKSKKAKVTKEPLETDDQSEETANLLPFPLPTDAKDSVDISNIETQNTLQLFVHLKKLKEEEENTQLDKSQPSQLDLCLDQVKKDVDSIEEEEKAKTSNVIGEEQKDSSVDKEEQEEVTVPVNQTEVQVNEAEVPVPEIEAEVPVTKEKTKKGKGKKKLSLLVKGKKTVIVNEQKASKKSGKADAESDSSEEPDKLFEQAPAFFRNAIAKAGKTKKTKKSKKSKAEKFVSPKTTPTTSSGEKHVSFNMEQNKALAFCVGTRIKTDENAFHPGKKPDIGILKPSPSPIRVSKKFSMDKKLSMLAKPTFMAHFF